MTIFHKGMKREKEKRDDIENITDYLNKSFQQAPKQS